MRRRNTSVLNDSNSLTNEAAQRRSMIQNTGGGSNTPSLTDLSEVSGAQVHFRSNHRRRDKRDKGISPLPKTDKFFKVINENLKEQLKDSISKLLNNHIAFKNMMEFVREQEPNKMEGGSHSKSSSSGHSKTKDLSISQPRIGRRRKYNQSFIKSQHSSSNSHSENVSPDPEFLTGKYKSKEPSPGRSQLPSSETSDERNPHKLKGRRLRKSTTLSFGGGKDMPLLQISEAYHDHDEYLQQPLAKSSVQPIAEQGYSLRGGRRKTELAQAIVSERISPKGSDNIPTLNLKKIGDQQSKIFFRNEGMYNQDDISSSARDKLKTQSERVENDGEYRGRVSNLLKNLETFYEKRLRVGFFLVILTAIQFKTHEKQKLDQIIHSPVPKLPIKKMESKDDLGPSRNSKVTSRRESARLHEAERIELNFTNINSKDVPEAPKTPKRQTINISEPSSNKEIDYTRIITAARLIINAQNNFNQMRSRALHCLTSNASFLKAQDQKKARALSKLTKILKSSSQAQLSTSFSLLSPRLSLSLPQPLSKGIYYLSVWMERKGDLIKRAFFEGIFRVWMEEKKMKQGDGESLEGVVTKGWEKTKREVVRDLLRIAQNRQSLSLQKSQEELKIVKRSQLVQKLKKNQEIKMNSSWSIFTKANMLKTALIQSEKGEKDQETLRLNAAKILSHIFCQKIDKKAEVAKALINLKIVSLERFIRKQKVLIAETQTKQLSRNLLLSSKAKQLLSLLKLRENLLRNDLILLQKKNISLQDKNINLKATRFESILANIFKTRLLKLQKELFSIVSKELLKRSSKANLKEFNLKYGVEKLQTITRNKTKHKNEAFSEIYKKSQELIHQNAQQKAQKAKIELFTTMLEWLLKSAQKSLINKAFRELSFKSAKKSAAAHQMKSLLLQKVGARLSASARRAFFSLRTQYGSAKRFPPKAQQILLLRMASLVQTNFDRQKAQALTKLCQKSQGSKYTTLEKELLSVSEESRNNRKTLFVNQLIRCYKYKLAGSLYRLFISTRIKIFSAELLKQKRMKKKTVFFKLHKNLAGKLNCCLLRLKKLVQDQQKENELKERDQLVELASKIKKDMKLESLNFWYERKQRDLLRSIISRLYQISLTQKLTNLEEKMQESKARNKIFRISKMSQSIQTKADHKCALAFWRMAIFNQDILSKEILSKTNQQFFFHTLILLMTNNRGLNISRGFSNLKIQAINNAHQEEICSNLKSKLFTKLSSSLNTKLCCSYWQLRLKTSSQQRNFLFLRYLDTLSASLHNSHKGYVFHQLLIESAKFSKDSVKASQKKNDQLLTQARQQGLRKLDSLFKNNFKEIFFSRIEGLVRLSQINKGILMIEKLDKQATLLSQRKAVSAFRSANHNQKRSALKYIHTKTACKILERYQNVNLAQSFRKILISHLQKVNKDCLDDVSQSKNQTSKLKAIAMASYLENKLVTRPQKAVFIRILQTSSARYESTLKTHFQSSQAQAQIRALGTLLSTLSKASTASHLTHLLYTSSRSLSSAHHLKQALALKALLNLFKLKSKSLLRASLNSLNSLISSRLSLSRVLASLCSVQRDKVWGCFWRAQVFQVKWKYYRLKMGAAGRIVERVVKRGCGNRVRQGWEGVKMWGKEGETKREAERMHSLTRLAHCHLIKMFQGYCSLRFGKVIKPQDIPPLDFKNASGLSVEVLTPKLVKTISPKLELALSFLNSENATDSKRMRKLNIASPQRDTADSYPERVRKVVTERTLEVSKISDHQKDPGTGGRTRSPEKAPLATLIESSSQQSLGSIHSTGSMENKNNYSSGMNSGKLMRASSLAKLQGLLNIKEGTINLSLLMSRLLLKRGSSMQSSSPFLLDYAFMKLKAEQTRNMKLKAIVRLLEDKLDANEKTAEIFNEIKERGYARRLGSLVTRLECLSKVICTSRATRRETTFSTFTERTSNTDRWTHWPFYKSIDRMSVRIEKKVLRRAWKDLKLVSHSRVR